MSGLGAEERLQRLVAAWLDLALPNDATWWATPNGGFRTISEAGRLKAMGVRAGVPDLFVLRGGLLLGVELKAPARRDARGRSVAAGRVSEVQLAYFGVLERCGCEVIVIDDLAALEAALGERGLIEARQRVRLGKALAAAQAKELGHGE